MGNEDYAEAAMHLSICPFTAVPERAFLKAFPVGELIARGYLPAGAGLRELTTFFGVSLRALRTRYRQSAAYKSCPYALAAWRRVGELEARQVLCARYRADRLRTALEEIRRLTREPIAEALSQIIVKCASTGVALVIVPEFKGCAVSGASQFLSPGKAMIQLSLRYKRDDQFYFSLFHEAGHLLKESKADLTQSSQSTQRDGRVQGAGREEKLLVGAELGLGPDQPEDTLRSLRPLREASVSEQEIAADAFARDLLIPPEVAGELPSLKTPEAVEAFARRIGVAPGIVVGRLHHDKLVPWNEMASLKRVMDLAFLEQGQEGMWATWLSVTEAARQLLHDLPQLDRDLVRARARVSEAAGRGAFLTNCRSGAKRRIEPTSFAAWRLRQRDRDLDAEERDEAA